MRIIDEDALDECRERWRCERCGKPTPSGCEPHHIFTRGAGRLDIRCNLIGLCRACHPEVQEGGKAARDECLLIVARRERMSIEDIEDIVNSLRRRPK